MADNSGRVKQPAIIFLGAAVLLSTLRLIGSFYPDDRLWGINHAGYIDGLWLLYPALIIMAIAIYLKSNQIESGFMKTAAVGQTSARKGFMPLVLLAVIWIAGFYLLSVKEFFLGDGHYLIASMANPDIGFKPRGHGEMLLHRLYMEWFWGVNDYYAYLSYRHLSVLAGTFYLATILFYGRKITSSPAAYYIFIALSLTTASTLLFYGYVENYSLLTAALAFFFISGSAAIQNREFSMAPILAYLAAVFLHFMALAYLPAFALYIVVFIGRKNTREAIGRHAGLIAAILFGSVLIIYAVVKLWGTAFWKIAFLSVAGDRFTIDNYALLSAPHLIDYLNLQVFLIPVTLTLSGLWLSGRWRRSNESTGSVSTPPMAFLAAGAAAGLAAAFIIDPKLGMARDWDLMSVFLIGAVFAGIYAWVRLFSRMRNFLIASIFLIIMHLSIFIPWLALNNHPKALYDYSVSMMELDPQRSRAGFFRMIAYNEWHNRPVEAARLNIYCRETFPEMWLNQNAMGLLVRGEREEAKMLLDQAQEYNPGFFSIYLNQAMYYLERGALDSVSEYLKAADALNPYNTFIRTFQGLVHYRSGNLDRAKSDWLKSLDFDARNPLPYLYLAYHYRTQNQPDSALGYLRRYPGMSAIYPVYFKLGTAHMVAGDSMTAFDMWEADLSSADSTQLNSIISDLLFIHRPEQ